MCSQRVNVTELVPLEGPVRSRLVSAVVARTLAAVTVASVHRASTTIQLASVRIISISIFDHCN